MNILIHMNINMIPRFLSFMLMAVMLMPAVGCNKDSGDDEEGLYMWFDISGKVVDQSGHPIRDIEVTAESAEPVLTDSDGYFSIRGGGVPASFTSITCSDKDEEVNGIYRTTTVRVDLVKYKEGQGFAEGYYRNKKEVRVVMTQDAVITPAVPDIEASPATGR